MEEYKIIIAKNHALKHNGKCLSTEYKGWHKKLIWQCEKGHEWEAIFNNVIKKNQWCSMCRRGRTNSEKDKLEKLQQAKDYAISKGGLCLSTEFINAKTKMKWKCSNPNHKEWDSLWYSAVIDNKWCTQCANENTKGKYRKLNGLEIAQNHAKSKGGKCLSTEYINYDEKMEFVCHNKKHKPFFAHLDSLLSKGSWCPECVGLNQQEFRTRNLLNYLLDTDFVKVKLDWNINPKTGRLLELDGYSKELNIAFEYQGKQHFKQVFNESLEIIQERDLIKKQNCIDNNVKLIYINEKPQIRKSSQQFLDDILLVLKENNIPIKKEIDLSIVNSIFMNHLMTTIQEEFLKKSQEYAKSKGGQLLSKEYIDSSSPLDWQCKNNHTFTIDYNHLVYRDRWCPLCMKNEKNKKRLDQLIKYVKNKQGSCLSTEYISVKDKIKFKCKNNHIFISDFDHVINKKKWCPQC